MQTAWRCRLEKNGTSGPVVVNNVNRSERGEGQGAATNNRYNHNSRNRGNIEYNTGKSKRKGARQIR